MRVALATALFANPDLLLLDEPTNHLDLEATLWLETWLARFPGAALLVSHDRGLLDRAVEAIAFLDRGKISLTPGGFDEFVRIRTERAMQQASAAKRIAAERAHIQSFIDRFRYKASKARQAQSRIKALARLPQIENVIEDAPTRFDFPEPARIAPPILTLERVAVGYDDAPVLRNVSLSIDMDDRIALLGANGNGKSTLAKLLAGRLAPLAGEMRRGPKLRVGYFAQHQTDELIAEESPIAHMTRALPRANPPQVRAQLARFGLDANRAETPVANLSGGEKARLLLALATRDAPQLLILDEPTNHLDIDAREALVKALADFQGAVLLITHDPHLVELIADRLWLVADGTVRPFDGDLDDYRALLAERARPAAKQDAGRAPRRTPRTRRCPSRVGSVAQAGARRGGAAGATGRRACGDRGETGRSRAVCAWAHAGDRRGQCPAGRDRPLAVDRRGGVAGGGGGARSGILRVEFFPQGVGWRGYTSAAAVAANAPGLNPSPSQVEREHLSPGRPRRFTPSSPSPAHPAASKSACGRQSSPLPSVRARPPPPPRPCRRTDRTRGRIRQSVLVCAPSIRNRKRAPFGDASSVVSQIGCRSASPSAAVPCGSQSGSAHCHSAASSAATRSAVPHSTRAR